MANSGLKCECGFQFSGAGEFRNCGAFITQDGQSGVICPKCNNAYVSGNFVGKFNEIEKGLKMTPEEQKISDDKDKIRLAASIFAAKELDKMFSKYDGGKRGWDDPARKEEVLRSLYRNLEQGDYVDAGNNCMILDGYQQQEKKDV